jgi:acyl-CoA thioester hydrolase
MIGSGAVFRWPVRVYYEDTDAGGIVYYANYLKFMERARTEWLRSRGIDVARLADTERLMFTVRAITLDFLQPARLSDNLDVSVAVGRMRKVSVELQQVVVRAGDVLCTGQVRLACVDVDTLKPRAMPETLVGETQAV